jgi:glycine hydroxymethyltransferase
VPFDKRKPWDPSGIRLGTAAVTSRGFKEKEMRQVGVWIDEIVTDTENEQAIAALAEDIKSFCKGFPAPGIN